jgi:hypothetical protein
MNHEDHVEQSAEEKRLDWQLSFLPGDQGGSAPSTQQTMFETGPAPKRHKDVPGQRVFFDEDGRAGFQSIAEEDTRHG